MKMKFLNPEDYQTKANEVFQLLKLKISLELPTAQIEHIGSSAVEGAISKGDLDIFVGIHSHEFNQSIEKLQGLGFKIKRQTLRTHELCMLECFDYDIDVGIQLVDLASKHTNFLTFRDALLKNSTLLKEYNQLKLDSGHLSDTQYRVKKSEFINKVLNSGTAYQLNEKEFDFWNKYLSTLTEPPIMPNVSANIAGNLYIADQLLGLYLSGKKTAGSSLAKDYEVTGDALPEIGNFWIILDSRKNPRCIVKTVQVETYQFDQVPEEVAVAEGEGDLSLDYWRKAHVHFFTPFLKEWGITNLDKEILITEFFELVYK